MQLRCDKCGNVQENPSRIRRTCNLHNVGEKTGYCQGVLRPVAQFNTSNVWQNPGQGHQDLEKNQ